MAVINALMGLVAFGSVAWPTSEAIREHHRRRGIAVVRAQLDPRLTVAELRERCQADFPPCYPSASSTRSPSTLTRHTHAGLRATSPAAARPHLGAIG